MVQFKFQLMFTALILVVGFVLGTTFGFIYPLLMDSKCRFDCETQASNHTIGIHSQMSGSDTSAASFTHMNGHNGSGSAIRQSIPTMNGLQSNEGALLPSNTTAVIKEEHDLLSSPSIYNYNTCKGVVDRVLVINLLNSIKYDENNDVLFIEGEALSEKEENDRILLKGIIKYSSYTKEQELKNTTKVPKDSPDQQTWYLLIHNIFKWMKGIHMNLNSCNPKIDHIAFNERKKKFNRLIHKRNEFNEKVNGDYLTINWDLIERSLKYKIDDLLRRIIFELDILIEKCGKTLSMEEMTKQILPYFSYEGESGIFNELLANQQIEASATDSEPSKKRNVQKRGIEKVKSLSARKNLAGKGSIQHDDMPRNKFSQAAMNNKFAQVKAQKDHDIGRKMLTNE